MMMLNQKITKFIYITKHCVLKAGLKFLLFLAVFMLTACYPAPIREVSRSMPEDTSASQRAALTQVYFYPKTGQTAKQQSRDHYECYNWAMDQTGFDPSASSIPTEQRVRVVPMPPPGHDTIVMSIAGAVLGALIAGPRHAAQGALIGGASGAAVGATSDISRQESARQLEEAYANRNQARDLRYERKALDFRRAMSACLEGRGYSVQY
jgi:hypothetical protein